MNDFELVWLPEACVWQDLSIKFLSVKVNTLTRDVIWCFHFLIFKMLLESFARVHLGAAHWAVIR